MMVRKEASSSCPSVSLLFLSKLRFHLEEHEMARKPLLKDDGPTTVAIRWSTSRNGISLSQLFLLLAFPIPEPALRDHYEK